MPIKDFLDGAKPVQAGQDFLQNANPVDEPPPVPKPPTPAGLTGSPAKPAGLLGHQEYQPVHSLTDLGENAVTGASNFGAGVLQAPYAIGHALLDPIQSSKELLSQYQDPISLLGPGAGAAREIVQGRGAELAGNLVGGAALGEIGGAASRGLTKATDPLKAYRSPLIPTEEAQARTITDKLGVPQAAYPQTMKAIQSNLGNIKEASSLTGGKFKNPLEFGNVARATGQPAHDLFQSQLIEPNAEAMTPHGSVGDIYNEITNLNEQLQRAYRNPLPSQTEATLGKDPLAEMKARKDMLTKTLYDEVSARSGLPVDEIRRVNQQGAALQDVGSEADAAQVGRTKGFSSPNTRFTYPQMAGRAFDWLRGGPERVAGRQISRVMGGVEQPPTPLPDTGRISDFRRMAEQEDLGHLRDTMGRQQSNQAGSEARKPSLMGPTEPPQATLVQPPKDYTKNFANNIRARSGENRANAIPPPEPPTPQNPLDKYLGRARETQEQSRLLRKGKQ